MYSKGIGKYFSSKPDSIHKGEFGENCNVSACQLEKSAYYYNISTEKFYCEKCASRINMHSDYPICFKVKAILNDGTVIY